MGIETAELIRHTVLGMGIAGAVAILFAIVKILMQSRR